MIYGLFNIARHTLTLVGLMQTPDVSTLQFTHQQINLHIVLSDRMSSFWSLPHLHPLTPFEREMN